MAGGRNPTFHQRHKQLFTSVCSSNINTNIYFFNGQTYLHRGFPRRQVIFYAGTSLYLGFENITKICFKNEIEAREPAVINGCPSSFPASLVRPSSKLSKGRETSHGPGQRPASGVWAAADRSHRGRARGPALTGGSMPTNRPRDETY